MLFHHLASAKKMRISRSQSNACPAFERDIRLDVCRGIALWFIYLDHIPGNICNWLTLRHYGFSDATEVFMFISGYTCAVAYGDVRRRAGWKAVIVHTLRRSWEIYLAFLALIMAIVVVVVWEGGSQLADETNVRILLQQPGLTLGHAMWLQYRPVNTDVLPVFALYHLLFAPLLWALMKAPNAVLAGSAFVYALIQLLGWNLPQWPRDEWYFNPIAWQLLVVLGAWWVVTGRERFQPLVTSRPVTVLALAYLTFSLVVALSWSIGSLELLVPQFVSKLIYPIDKSNLSPLRLLHFMALAVLITGVMRPGWPGLSTAVLRGAAWCGEHSLEIYCLCVLLSLVARVLLLRFSDGLAAQVAVSAAGILVMTGFAALLHRVGGGRHHVSKLL